MNTAIVYYSMSGNVEYVAKKISEKTGAELIRIKPKKAFPDKGFKKFLWGGKSAVMGETPELEEYTFDADKYEYIIMGSPVWAARFAPPIRTFVKDNKEKLKNKKISAYACYSGSGADKALEKLREYLEIEKFENELVVIDPKDRPFSEKEKQIGDFCEKIK